MFKRFTLFIVLFLAAHFSLLAQTQNYSAPVKWEKYKISDKDISILLPKMPILVESSNSCEETESKLYAVFAEETAYQIIIYSKSKTKIPAYCEVKSEFGIRTFERTTAVFNTDKQEVSRLKIREKETVKFSAKLTTYWIINDLENDKFVVLAVTNRNGIKPDVERFIQSLDFKKNTDGIEIKKGSDRNYGDQITEGPKDQKVKLEAKTDEPLYLVVKPRANYTDAARQANIQGVVTLRVTFLENGGIGNIETVTGLPYGLTEQSILSASKIIFLPQKKSGTNISVTKTVQYSFTIY